MAGFRLLTLKINENDIGVGTNLCTRSVALSTEVMTSASHSFKSRVAAVVGGRFLTGLGATGGSICTVGERLGATGLGGGGEAAGVGVEELEGVGADASFARRLSRI